MSDRSSSQFVSRAGDKLAAALDAFHIDPTGQTCADLGCNVGGFTDCLLQRAATRVYAIDTGYGALAWKLRKDPRVVVMERTNALHVSLSEPVSLITIDVGWTRQDKILPAALRLLGPTGRIVTLIKPHYEAAPADLRRGVLLEDRLELTLAAVRARLAALNISLTSLIESPLQGQKGNREILALVLPSAHSCPQD